MISEEQLLSVIDRLNTHQLDGRKSLHKPLLLLLALARVQQGKERLMLFSDIEKPFSDLLLKFVPPRAGTRPEDPFSRLRGEGIWELSAWSDDVLREKKLTKLTLREQKVKGGFTVEVFELLSGNEQLIDKIARKLLRDYFHKTDRQRVVAMVGLTVQLDDVDEPELDQTKPINLSFGEKILNMMKRLCGLLCGWRR